MLHRLCGLPMLKAFIDRDAYFPSSENGGRQSLLLGLSGISSYVRKLPFYDVAHRTNAVAAQSRASESAKETKEVAGGPNSSLDGAPALLVKDRGFRAGARRKRLATKCSSTHWKRWLKILILPRP